MVQTLSFQRRGTSSVTGERRSPVLCGTAKKERQRNRSAQYKAVRRIYHSSMNTVYQEVTVSFDD